MDRRWRELLGSIEGAADLHARSAAPRRSEILGSRFGLDIRSGLHTGEIEVIGDDVGGIAVHIGARVRARARAGEVVVS